MLCSVVCISVVVLLCLMPGTGFAAATHTNQKRATTTNDAITRGMAAKAINDAEANKKAIQENKQAFQALKAEMQAVKVGMQAAKTETSSLSAKIISEVARNRVTRQSSTRSLGYSSIAVDGNTGQYWDTDGCTATNWDVKPWWSVELAELKTIRWVTIWNRRDCCADRLQNVNVYVSNNASPHAGGNKQLCASHHGQLGSVTTLYCNKLAPAKYVIIQIWNSTPALLTVCEVQVYATD